MLLPNIEIFHDYIDWFYEPRSSESFKNRLTKIDYVSYSVYDNEDYAVIKFKNAGTYEIHIGEYNEFLRERNLELLLN